MKTTREEINKTRLAVCMQFTFNSNVSDRICGEEEEEGGGEDV